LTRAVSSPPAFPVIILGMHRSGTSIVTQCLEKLGLFVGGQLQGDYESTYFLKLNETVFQNVSASWDNPLAMSDFFACPPAVELTSRYLRDQLNSPGLREFLGWRQYFAVRNLERFNRPWGWKDPRNIFTLPLWLNIFPNSRLLYIVRNGVDVAASLLKREQDILRQRIQRKAPYKGSAKCLRLPGAFRLWEQYLAQAEDHFSRFHQPLHVLRYEDLLSDPRRRLSGLAKFCQLPNPDDATLKTAAAEIRPRPAGKKSRDPVMDEFFQSVRNSRWMKRFGYCDGN
jgi:hypothetical protein